MRIWCGLKSFLRIICEEKSLTLEQFRRGGRDESGRGKGWISTLFFICSEVRNSTVSFFFYLHFFVCQQIVSLFVKLKHWTALSIEKFRSLSTAQQKFSSKIKDETIFRRSIKRQSLELHWFLFFSSACRTRQHKYEKMWRWIEFLHVYSLTRNKKEWQWQP